MRKKLLLFRIIILFFFHLNSFSQNRNSVWCFGDSAGIDFSDINNPIPIETGLDTRGSCVSISDSSGQLLFYADTRAGYGDSTTLVYNKINQVMQNGLTIVGEGWYHELVIVPNPETNNEYFLFSIAVIYPQGLFYSKIDMSQNGGLGAVTQKNIPINSFRNADCLTAIKHANGRDWWVFSKYSTNNTNLNKFYVYLVTNNQIHPPNIQSFNNSRDCDFQTLVFNSTGSKFMQLNTFGLMQEFDFDRCTGIISNPVVYFPEINSGPITRMFWDGAYSADDSKIYINTNLYNVAYNDTCWLLQYDLIAPDIPQSCDTLHFSKYPIIDGAVRLAPDHKIYYSTFYTAAFPWYPYADSVYNQYNMNLGVVNFPDSAGSACDFQPYSFYLNGKRTYWGLPNNPNYELGPLVGSGCDTLTSEIENFGAIHSQLTVFYHHTWKKAFINAANLKGNKGVLFIYNTEGKLISQQNFKPLNGYFTLDFDASQLSLGTYVVTLTTEKERLVKNFIVQ